MFSLVSAFNHEVHLRTHPMSFATPLILRQQVGKWQA